MKIRSATIAPGEPGWEDSVTAHLGRTELTTAERQVVVEVESSVGGRLLAIADAWGERNETSRELVEAMADEGLFGFTIPREHGGQGRDVGYSRSLCLIREILGYHSPALDISYALQGLGTGAIVRMGDDDQKRDYLPDLVAGRKLFAFGLTEPDAGSDVLGMSTTARVTTDGYVLDGRKMFISGAPDADVYVVFARSGEPRTREIDAFIVEKGTEGFVPSGGIELASPHAIGYLQLDDCHVPRTSRIGAPGEGLAASLGTLEIYRPSVGAFAAGAGTRAWELARDFATERRAFGTPLADNPVIRGKLARMWARLEAARSLVYRAAKDNDEGLVSGWRSGIAKLAATEAAIHAADESQQIHGGRGVIAGSRIEALVRALRPTAIYEGTSEIQRSIIGREEAKRARELEAGASVAATDVLAAAQSDGHPSELVGAIEMLERCERTERDVRIRLAEAPRDVLRQQPLMLRLADVRVAIEGLREVVLDGLRLGRDQDAWAPTVVAAAALLACEARDVLGREILEIERTAAIGVRDLAIDLLAADSAGRDQLEAVLASRLLGD